MKILFYVAVAMMLTACFPEEKDSPYTAVYNIMSTQTVAEFGTTKFTVKKIIKHSDMPREVCERLKINDTKRLVKCSATLKAGIDISSGKYDVEVNGNQVILRLPHAKIIEPVVMDINNINIEYPAAAQQKAKLSMTERMAYLQAGERLILTDQNIIDQIVSQAEKNALPLYRTKLKSLGYKAVKIEFVQ